MTIASFHHVGRMPVATGFDRASFAKLGKAEDIKPAKTSTSDIVDIKTPQPTPAPKKLDDTKAAPPSFDRAKAQRLMSEMARLSFMVGNGSANPADSAEKFSAMRRELADILGADKAEEVIGRTGLAHANITDADSARTTVEMLRKAVKLLRS